MENEYYSHSKPWLGRETPFFEDELEYPTPWLDGPGCGLQISPPPGTTAEGEAGWKGQSGKQKTWKHENDHIIKKLLGLIALEHFRRFPAAS